jgi:branched-chain amino acid transport system substrate-binding protein
MRRTGIAAASMLTAAAAMLAGCGGGKAGVPGDRISGTTLTVYASVPLHGASRFNARSVVSGAQLALAQARGRVGKYRIVLKPLDDSTPQRAEWDPGQTTVNARRASQDRTTIGYIGEFNSGASAISIPLLNRFEIPQISPASTAVGLTSTAAGAAPGEPDKYYPTGIRTFARVVPNDLVQAGAQVKLQRSLGCRKTYVVDDGEVDGEDMADSFELVARSAGLDVVGVQAFQRGASDYTAFAASVAQSGADCVLVSAITDSGAVPVTRQIAAALPGARIFGSAGVAESAFTDPAQGGIPLALDPRVLLTTATLGAGTQPPAARAFYAAYTKRYGLPQLSAIYGYEAMSLMLAAISRATDRGRHPALRSKVLAAIFDTRNRQSVLGTYSIDSVGDVTIRRYGVYKVADGIPEFWKAIDG